MATINKRLKIAFLIVALVILFSTAAHAKPFTEAFENVLTRINDFFDKEQYKAYSKTIDFFVFAIVFIAVYFKGVKFAFKEVTKTEKVLAIILGLTTAFLMVIRDFSIAALLPFVNWFLYFLLFALIWRMLKNMKSKFWRFIVALLLAVLIILIAQWLFGVFTVPEAGEAETSFFSDIAESLGRIEMPQQPEVPEFLRAPSAPSTVTTSEEKVIQETPTPEEKKEEKPAAGKPATPEEKVTVYSQLAELFGAKINKEMTDNQATNEILSKGKEEAGGREFGKDKETYYVHKNEKGELELYKKQPFYWRDTKIPREEWGKLLEEEKKLRPAPPVPGAPKPPAPGGAPSIAPPPVKPGAGQRTEVEGLNVQKAGIFDSPWSLLWLLILGPLAFAFRKPNGIAYKGSLKLWNRVRGKKEAEKTIQEIIARIDKIISDKKAKIDLIKRIQARKMDLIKSEDLKRVYLEMIKTRKGRAFLFEEEATFEKIDASQHELLILEKDLIFQTKDLVELELDFLKRLAAWRAVLTEGNTNIANEIQEFNHLIRIGDNNVTSLILGLYTLEEQVILKDKELKILLKKRKRARLIKKKFDMFVKEENRLHEFFEDEKTKIELLDNQIAEQIRMLEQLKSKIQPTNPEEQLRHISNYLEAIVERLDDLIDRFPDSAFELEAYKNAIIRMQRADLDLATSLLGQSADDIRHRAGRYANHMVFPEIWTQLAAKPEEFHIFVNNFDAKIREETKGMVEFIKQMEAGKKPRAGRGISRRDLVKGALAVGVVAGGAATAVGVRKLLSKKPKIQEETQAQVIIKVKLYSNKFDVYYVVNEPLKTGEKYKVAVFISMEGGQWKEVGKASDVETNKESIVDVPFKEWGITPGKHFVIVAAESMKGGKPVYSQEAEIQIK